MHRQNCEVKLRESFIKMYKRDIGKGPVEASISIVKNHVIVEFNGVLTKLEINLLDSGKGEEPIRETRKKIKETVIESHINVIEQTLQCNVIDFLSKLSIEHDSIYIMFIADRNLEN